MSQGSIDNPEPMGHPAAVAPAAVIPPPFQFRELFIVAAFCLAFAFCVYRFADTASVTYDEPLHLPAGYSYLLWSDYRMGCGHPPFLKKLAALPLLKLGVWPQKSDFLTLDESPSPSASLLRLQHFWELALVDSDYAQWNFGRILLFGIQDDALRRFGVSAPDFVPQTANLERADFLNNADRMLLWGRMMILLLGLLLAVLIYLWARELHGVAGGVLALALFCFDPNCIAHSGLVTTDIGVVVFMFGAVYFLWRTCRRLSLANTLLTALFFALAFVSKFSAVLLLPMFGLLGLWRVLTREDWPLGRSRFLAGWGSKTLAFTGLFFACGVAAFVMIWAVYDFRYSAIADPPKSAETVRRLFPDIKVSHELGTLPIVEAVQRTAAQKSLLRQYPADIPEAKIQAAMATATPGLSGNLILFARRHHLLPEAYIYGFANEEMRSFLRQSFLMGEISWRGFRSYYLWCFLFKTPLPGLLLIGAALVLVFRTSSRRLLPLAFFAVPLGVLGLALVNTGINIGHRHMLLVYPFLYVACGILVVRWRLWSSVVRRWTAFGALGVIALSSIVVFAPPWKPALIFPHYLAYFNELAGGPRQGHKLLANTNLDWGQDLKGLKKWLEVHICPGQSLPVINLAYCGTGDPRYYGIQYLNMPGDYNYMNPRENFCRNNDGSISLTTAIVPGWLAISANYLVGVGLSPQTHALWRETIKHATLVDTVGYSIFVYKLTQPSFLPAEKDKAEIQPESLSPDYAALGNIGATLLTTEWRLAEAMEYLRRALQINPDYADAHYYLGIALVRQGKLVEAILHYERALQLKPDFVEVRYNLGNVLVAQGKLPEAVLHYERALQLKPDYAKALISLGNVLVRQGKLNQAVPHFERALQLQPDYADTHYYLGIALAAQANLTDAIRHYERAIQLNPDLAGAHINLSDALIRQGRVAEAIPHCERALQLNPDLAEAHINLADALTRQGRLAEAIPHYERALQLNPNQADAHFGFANALVLQGKSIEALPHFQQALQLATARNNLSLAESISNKLQSLSPPRQ